MIDERKLDKLIKLGSYKPIYILYRVLIVSFISIAIFYLIETLSLAKIEFSTTRFNVYLMGVLAFNSVSELNLFLMNLMGKSERLKWDFRSQIIIVSLVSILLSYAWKHLAKRTMGTEQLIQEKAIIITLFAGMGFIVIHLLVVIISKLLKEWMLNRKEINELREAKLLNDYKLLKEHLNPHFLFNNLSVLKSLIRYKPELAEVFIQNFTNVYRYVLYSQEVKTVLLKEELKFLSSYISLHKERIGDGLCTNIKIDTSYLNSSVPPMSLQILVENAIKHNVANKLHPLQINIYIENGHLVIHNILNKKENQYSTRTGLKNLSSQYKLLGEEEVQIIEDETSFAVYLPIL